MQVKNETRRSQQGLESLFAFHAFVSFTNDDLGSIRPETL